MINTCFYPFGQNKDGSNESKALQKFLQQGGGVFGTHCADLTFTSAATMPLYNQLLGGWAHNGQNVNGTTCTTKATHPASMLLPPTFDYKGNVDVADVTKDATVLVECKYGNTTKPVSWVRTEMGGRARFLHQLRQGRFGSERRSHRRQPHHRRPPLGPGPLASRPARSGCGWSLVDDPHSENLRFK